METKTNTNEMVRMLWSHNLEVITSCIDAYDSEIWFRFQNKEVQMQIIEDKKTAFLHMENNDYHAFKKKYEHLLQRMADLTHVNLFCIGEKGNVNEMFAEKGNSQGEILKELAPRLVLRGTALRFQTWSGENELILEDGLFIRFNFQNIKFQNVSQAKLFMENFMKALERTKNKEKELEQFIMGCFEEQGISKVMRIFQLELHFAYKNDFECGNLFLLHLPFQDMMDLAEGNGYRLEKIKSSIHALKNTVLFMEIAKQYDPRSFLNVSNGMIKEEYLFVFMGRRLHVPEFKDEQVSMEEMERKIKAEKLKNVVMKGVSWGVPYRFSRLLDDRENEEEIFLQWIGEKFDHTISVVKKEHVEEFKQFITEKGWKNENK